MVIIGGRYDLQRQLGPTGAQGEVYEAVDLHERDRVAIKLFHQVTPGEEWKEAVILRRLADRHILPIRNADLANGQPYLVTDVAHYGTIEDQITSAGSRGVDIDDVLRWTRHACGGVARGHDLRLLHNDLKPGNLFLDGDGECLVGDFGLASLIPPGELSALVPGFTFHTVSPEIAADPLGRSGSVKSDIFSLGATAYWMVAGHPALDLSACTTHAECLALVASTAPARLFDVAPHVPLQLQTVIEKAMAPDPNDRYSTVADLAAALGGCTRRAGRRWQRTDLHAAHIACFTGTSPNGATTVVVCVELGSRPTRANVTTRSASSGNRIKRACRTDVPIRSWQAAARAAMRDAA